MKFENDHGYGSSSVDSIFIAHNYMVDVLIKNKIHVDFGNGIEGPITKDMIVSITDDPIVLNQFVITDSLIGINPFDMNPVQDYTHLFNGVKLDDDVELDNITVHDVVKCMLWHSMNESGEWVA